jgi:hypothetical protein
LKLKVNFTDFWPDFILTDNYFWRLLSERYELEISNSPDILFFSVFGNEHKKYNCFKVFFTGENYKPSQFDAHLSLSYYNETERNIRYPLYLLYEELDILLNKRSPEIIYSEKKKFCCFIVSNKSCRQRNQFFKKLSKYKRVDSGGKYLNNIGVPIENKIEFIKDYKFIICFENISFPGYTTEKIIEAMKADCIPIYWGNANIGQEFNTDSFINVHDYKNYDDVIERVIAVDNNEKEYLTMLKKPWLINNKVPENLTKEYLLNKIILTKYEYENNYNFRKLPHLSKFYTLLDKIQRKLRGERKFD